ncbi:flagellar type III secretion system protein FlhB [Modestobacter sp. I12A-02628]|uniref:EscU/YscU/HrcU family type III secretion system export apparatus switch protein n=1 Tax=Goekera deserti TaxID=2497753 RepID=A0A7K3WI28_9ACTN|nr:EscU/YscU/HrcU family type III secretion system export apparatus switch protein [Goekera deserti]MPQ99484.1 flagellar type III secretion system protein FlhB [Goekera deserti]NDI48971.1 flagellar type III secretion system protein FlhB [Goekera deserti]NEL55559.1 EscU/YscU/HrcU family type III secretion system export apparatus switch protein [Goekera deserti]
MAKDGPGGEKTEKPTAQKLQKAKKDGQSPKTQELSTWAGVAAASVLLPMLARSGFTQLRQLFVTATAVFDRPQAYMVTAMLGDAVVAFFTAILPLALGMMVVGTLGYAVQGVHVSAKPMKPTFAKINPFSGLKRMFGTHGLWETAKALVKTVALGTVIWSTADTAKTLVSGAGSMSLTDVVAIFTDAAVTMFRVTAVTGLVLAVADYAYQRHTSMKQLKMSLYEIKQEYKQNEGDPHMKAQRKAVAMEMSRNRMMTAVTEADVLLVNPTHVAVALKYEAGTGAPRVVAKGRDEIAAELRRRAEEARVPLVHDIPLARALYASTDLDQEVPPQLFTAVARVLAFVMHLGSRGVVGGVHRPGFAAPDTTGLPTARRR